MKLKILLAGALLLLPALAEAQRPPIPLFSGPWDPANTQASVNTLILEINAILTPILGGQTGAVNFPTLTGGLTGAPGVIGLAPAADANAGIQINPNGSGNIILFGSGDTGVLQFGNATAFLPLPGMALAPGVLPNKAPLGMSDHLTGYFIVQDWLGRGHGVAAY